MKKRNPYRFITLAVNRFRGLWEKDSRQNMGPEYAGGVINVTSHKIGQLDTRDGQAEDTSYPDGIINADRFTNLSFVHALTDVYIEALAPILIQGIPDYDPPSTWNPPPWNPPSADPTCDEIWALLNTPAGEQKAGGIFPDCFLVPTLNCEDLWSMYNTPMEYRKVGGVYPDCLAYPPPPPPYSQTCADLWVNAPNLSDYEVVANADVSVRDGNIDPCWKQTCSDLWTLYPHLSDYEIAGADDLELIQTGGQYGMDDCWNTETNCQQLYALHPEWDEYRVENPTFPDCWDFTSDPPTPTCEQFWADYNIPEESRNYLGEYPDCVILPPPPDPPPQGGCTFRLFSFPSSTDLVTWSVGEGYVASDTKTPYDFQVDAHMDSDTIGNSLSYNIVGPFELVDPEDGWFYDYTNVAPPCRRLVTYGVNIQLGAGLSQGTYDGRIDFTVTIQGIPHLYSLPLQATVTENWLPLWTTYNEWSQMVGLGAIDGNNFSSVDWNDYDTAYNWILDMQSVVQTTANIQMFKRTDTSWNNKSFAWLNANQIQNWTDLKTLAGSLGWRRTAIDPSDPEFVDYEYGFIQYNDILMPSQTFEDLAQLCEQMKVVGARCNQFGWIGPIYHTGGIKITRYVAEPSWTTPTTDYAPNSWDYGLAQNTWQEFVTYKGGRDVSTSKESVANIEIDGTFRFTGGVWTETVVSKMTGVGFDLDTNMTATLVKQDVYADYPRRNGDAEDAGWDDLAWTQFNLIEEADWETFAVHAWKEGIDPTTAYPIKFGGWREGPLQSETTIDGSRQTPDISTTIISKATWDYTYVE
jgi:hypothetical protein